MNLFKRMFQCFLFCLSLTFSISVNAQRTGNCISITTGVCNAVVGGVTNFTPNQLNWTLTNAYSVYSIEYDYRMGGCGFANPDTNGGFTFGVVDTLTGNVLQSYNPDTSNNYPQNQFGQYGNIHCTGQALYENGFDFSITGIHPVDSNNAIYSNMAWSQVISQFLDSIPNGSILLMYAVSMPPYTKLWSQDSNLVNKLAAMGATDLKLLCDTNSSGHLPAAPYIFWTIKGNPSLSGQAVGTNYNTPLTASFCYDTAGTTTGIANINPAADFRIYPNPINRDNRFTISSPQSGNIVFYDAIGRVLDESKLSNGVNSVKLNSYENEVVFYKTIFEDGSVGNGKLIFTQ